MCLKNMQVRCGLCHLSFFQLCSHVCSILQFNYSCIVKIEEREWVYRNLHTSCPFRPKSVKRKA